MKRYIIAVDDETFEYIEAHKMTIIDGGGVLFTDEDEQLLCLYSAGSFRTIVPDDN